MDRQEVLIDIVRHIIGGLSLGAGVYSGVITPDLDISLFGIGSHRNFAFHSSAPAKGISWVRKKAYNRLKQKWGDTRWLEEVNRQAAFYTAGFALGQAGHFIADATWQGSKAVLFPFMRLVTGHSSLVPGTLIDDHAWLWGNTIWALQIAYQELKVALGEEHPVIRAIEWAIKKIENIARQIKNWLKEKHDWLTGKTSYDSLMKAIDETKPGDPVLETALAILEGRA